MALIEADAAAIGAAIRILTEAGYRVTKAGKATHDDAGVEFRLDVEAPTRTPQFQPRVEAVKDAAIDTPEIGMDGEIVEAEDD